MICMSRQQLEQMIEDIMNHILVRAGHRETNCLSHHRPQFSLKTQGQSRAGLGRAENHEPLPHVRRELRFDEHASLWQERATKDQIR